MSKQNPNLNLKKHYELFLKANLGVQHYASHSHHYWPDVTRQATLDYWDDSAKFVDDKWDFIFSEKVPRAQKYIANVLNLSSPGQIVFAPNTHEFIVRLLSCFDGKSELSVLTTDSEFHSFERQINRLNENGRIAVDKVSTEDFATFTNRFIEKIKSKNYDLIFLSQVFFNSGLVVDDLETLVNSAAKDTLFVIDGYHGFMAVPTSLKSIEDRAFYIAGSYKYAQGGEGCCFMHVPKSCKLRPANTGWFAGFSDLSLKTDKVNYSNDGYRFAGSTMDFSGLYRLLSVFELFEKENVTVEMIHGHIQNLQANFRSHLAELKFEHLTENKIIKRDFNKHGHFYAFELGSAELVKAIHDRLKEHNVRTDYRGSRLRFGFGLYQEDCINLNGIKNL